MGATRSAFFSTGSVELAHDEYLSPKSKNTPTKHALFLHGILGNKRNWRTPSKLLAKGNDNMQVIAADHRGHGGSHGKLGTNKNTVESCALDVHALVANTLRKKKMINGRRLSDTNSAAVGSGGTATKAPAFAKTNDNVISCPDLLAGHSFGGKVALTYLQDRYNRGQELPQDTWILDCLPGLFDTTAGNPDHTNHSVQGIFNILADLPTRFKKPADVTTMLTEQGISLPVAQWLTSNCRAATDCPERNEMMLGFDLPVCTELFHDFCLTDTWPFLKAFDGRRRAYGGKDANIHFVRAGRNPLWVPSVLEQFEQITNSSQTTVHLHTMSHVGHWLHVEDVRGMIDLIQEHSNSLR